MKIIKKLSKMIECEIEDAKNYADCALKTLEDNKELAELFYTLSTEEIGHMERLHKAVVDIIKDYRAKNGEPPADMMAVYNYVHEKQIEATAEVKVLQAMFKEQR